MREQCRLLDVPRGTLYYAPRGPKASDLAAMRWLNEQYTATPFYGVERLTGCLPRDGVRIGHNQVRWLLRVTGLETLYPKPRLSKPKGPEHGVYPYLLRGVRIDRPNQVWSSDISLTPTKRGRTPLDA